MFGLDVLLFALSTENYHLCEKLVLLSNSTITILQINNQHVVHSSKMSNVQGSECIVNEFINLNIDEIKLRAFQAKKYGKCVIGSQNSSRVFGLKFQQKSSSPSVVAS